MFCLFRRKVPNYSRPGADVPAWAVDLKRQCDIIILQNDLVRRGQERIMSAIDDLTAQVSANKTVIGSALELIQGFAARVAAAGTDPTKLSALQADLKSQDDALAAAVAANTPAAIPAPAADPAAPAAPAV